MAQETLIKKEGNKYFQIIFVAVFILVSLAYFGNFWAETLREESGQPQQEVLSAQETAQQNQPPLQEISNKTEKPVVELFVMSFCPYGTQMEKAILPAINALGEAVDFQLKFVDYAMHGKPELDEQLSEYCIQKNEPDKFIHYLECFLEDSDTRRCVEETKLNADKLDSCINSTDVEFKVSASFEDKSTWKSGTFPIFPIYQEDNEKYGIKGSPSLVINEESLQVSSRTPNVLLKSICSAFIDAPKECNQELSTEVPTPGFGWVSSPNNSSDASCN